MFIRKMRLDDAFEVATIHTLSWQTAYKGIVDQKLLDSIDIQKRTANWKTGIETNTPPIVRLVVERDGQVIGFACGLENRTKTEAPNCDSELWAIYVHPKHSREGAGHALFNYFKAELCRLGKRKLCVWTLKENNLAKAFYEKQGGALFGSKHIKIGDQTLPEVGYEFAL